VPKSPLRRRAVCPCRKRSRRRQRNSASEGATRDRALGIGAKLLLYRVGLRQREEAIGIEARFDQRRVQHLGVVHFFWFRPHITIDLVNIAVELSELPCRDGTAHDRQRVDRKERVGAITRDAVAPDEALGFEPRVFGLVPDAGEAFGGRAIVGQLEHAAQQYRNIIEFRAGAPLDLRNDQMRQISIRTTEIEMKFDPGHGLTISPRMAGFRARTTTGIPRLLVDLPIGFGNRGRAHQPGGVEISQLRLALALLDAIAHPFGIDSGIHDQMRDMDVLRAELARRALRHRAQPEFSAGESGITDAAPEAGGRAGEKDVAAGSRQHQPRRLTRRQKPGIAGQLPNLTEHPLGGFEQRKIDIGANVEDADFQRRRLIGIAQECGDLFFVAGVQRAASDPPAIGLDLRDERSQLFAISPPRKDGKAFAGEFPRDGGADVIAGANHRHRGIPGLHVQPPPAGLNSRQVVVAVAQRRPSLSSSFPSAKAARLPTETTRPSARTGPLASVRAR
jgi:hypothetical protein